MEKNLYLVGLNHKTAPLDLREDYLSHIADIPEALKRLHALCDEAVILSTCNRLEIIYMNDQPLTLESLAPNWQGSLEHHSYMLQGVSAVQHIF